MPLLSHWLGLRTIHDLIFHEVPSYRPASVLIGITSKVGQQTVTVSVGAARTALTDGRVVKPTQRLGSSRTN